MKLNPPNPLDARLTLGALEAALALPAYALAFTPQAKQAAIELEQFPSMVKSFEQHRRADGLPPTQAQFVAGFEADYRAAHAKLFAPSVHAATVARLQKTYPSLVRDLHLFLLCRESKKFYRVVRDPELDERFGIDLLILGAQQREYYVCATVGTESARSWRSLKRNSRDRIRPERAQLRGEFIELPLDAHKQVIGAGRHPWHLYSPLHVEQIVAHIARARKGLALHGA